MDDFFKHSGRSYTLLFFITCLTLLLSLNIAWLNPRPDYSVVKVPKIPLGWQYNLDSGMNLLTATYFPDYFVYNAQRISRPVVYAVVHIFSSLLLFISQPFASPSPLMAHAAGFLALKFLVYFFTAALYFRLLLFYMPALPAFLASAMLLTQHLSITYISTFVDTEAQWLSPILIAYLLHSLCSNYSVKKNVIFSMGVGVLMLTKQNYAMYLAILAWGLSLGRYREVATSMAAYSVPYVLWRSYVAFKGIPYFNPQITVEGYGVAYFKELWSAGTLSFIQSMLHSWRDYLVSWFLVYHVALLLCLSHLSEFVKRYGNVLFRFVGLFIFMNWFQFFATRKTINTVMVGDCSFLIWGGGALALTLYLDGVKPVFRKYVYASLMVAWLTFHILSLANFPWVHPSQQKEAPMKDKYLSVDAPVPTYQWFPDGGGSR